MSFAPLSFKVAATLAAYRIVKVGAAGNAVAYATTTTDYQLGVTTDDVKALSEAIPVMVNGIAKIQFNDTCTLGAFVTSDANGLGVKAAANTAGVYCIGVLIGPAVTETGTLADVLIQPIQIQIP